MTVLYLDPFHLLHCLSIKRFITCVHTSAGILILMLASVPIAVVWLNSESILLLLRQVPCVARSAAVIIFCCSDKVK